jgi:hypothetical protein
VVVRVIVAVIVARVRMPMHGADVGENRGQGKGALTATRLRFSCSHDDSSLPHGAWRRRPGFILRCLARFQRRLDA